MSYKERPEARSTSLRGTAVVLASGGLHLLSVHWKTRIAIRLRQPGKRGADVALHDADILRD